MDSFRKMGSPEDMEDAGQGPSSHTKATFSGTTAFIGVIALIITIIAVAVPNWGNYAPLGQAFAAAVKCEDGSSQRAFAPDDSSPFHAGRVTCKSGFNSQDNTGHFGPFQVCTFRGYYSICSNQYQSYYKPSTWLIVAGICGIIAILALSFFSLFAILHVAMQLQRREIWISFKRDVFLKLVTSSIAVVTTLASVILGAIEFSLSGRHNFLQYNLGVCYYLMILLIFVDILLVILSYMSYRRSKKYPLNLVPKGRARDYVTGAYDNQYMDNGNNGVSMTTSSGLPYTHGTPRYPIHPQPSSVRSAQTYTANAISSYANGHTLPTLNFSTAGSPGSQPGPQMPNGSSGFMAVNLHATNGSSTSPSSSQPQPLPIQAIRPIQPQGIPQVSVASSSIPPHPVNLSHLPQVLPTGGTGVSFTPQGRSGYTKMGHAGSVESLDSTQSLTLSTFSNGSTTSTGSASKGPLRSSLKKPKNKDTASITSESSSKRVRYGLGAEQTTV